MENFLRSRRIRWVSPVGNDASTGGGVACAVNLLMQSNVVPRASFLSLLGLDKWAQVWQAISDIYQLDYRKYIVHSVFSPYSLVLLLSPFKGRIVILPHGELKNGALKISERRKAFYMRVIKRLGLFYRFKSVYLVASNHEEIFKAEQFLELSDVLLAPDIVDASVPLPTQANYNVEKGVTLITIARLVPNKAVADLMRHLVFVAKAGQLDWLSQVVLFVTAEDHGETAAVHEWSDRLVELGKPVQIYEGLGRKEIGEIASRLPNKLCFLSSRFESFSYALLETLYFEYAPIVWFENELVEGLASHGLCIQLKPGQVVTDSTTTLLRKQDLVKAELFVRTLSEQTGKLYRNFLNRLMYGDV